MFRLELLPASEGDCLILSWGRGDIRYRILIDGGRSSTATAVKAYVAKHQLGKGAFELFVITHIDRDHIEGAVELLGDDDFRPLIKQVWFNDRADLTYQPRPGFEEYGALDGERITRLIVDNDIPANTNFAPKPVALVDDTLPFVGLADGLTITLLSPDLNQLAALAGPWDETLEAAPEGWEDLGEDESLDVSRLALRQFKTDDAKPNGSSIAFVASYDNHHVLLTGDSHVRRILTSLDVFKAAHPEIKGFSLVKASHHGSRGNTSLELVRALACRRWAISTNGTQFRHPDRDAIARIISASPGPVEIFFNYTTEQTNVWKGMLKGAPAFAPKFGVDGYIAIDIA
ncbi:hypothetical protein GCM10007881_62930 [Mesorhizobium huakuii]|uniref:ComEC/Rec2 family competence protein n=1 Tax=Mesorhizobium huakuii TaxID=28104 RepID=UPI00235D0745|nr:hypothetical protein [Mesorhizobium huakuii]GLQ82770.1 hypothetical protein GCM10007881_62930 [Mesorhizobium huakuii]